MPCCMWLVGTSCYRAAWDAVGRVYDMEVFFLWFQFPAVDDPPSSTPAEGQQ